MRKQKVHLIAIGGVGMASLAGLLRDAGFVVRGSDQDLYPPMSTLLERMRIPVATGFKPENLDWQPNFAVVGNAVSRNNAEVQEVIRKKIPYLSFPEVLERLFLVGKHCIVVAGTHGKTTTSSLVGWLLENAGTNPSFLVGGIPKNFGRGYQLREGKFFVVEGDEYDTAFFDKSPKFLHYQPHTVLLTRLEYDHADIYQDLDQVKEAFRKFVGLIPEGGELFYNGDDPLLKELAAGARCACVPYGMTNDAEWRADIVEQGPEGVVFDVLLEGQALFRSRLPLIGQHNVCNALGAIALVWGLGLRKNEIISALSLFQGVDRRLERVADLDGVTLYDDFAHHPTAVRATLDALRSAYPARRLWAVFEPRSNTARRNVFQQEFVQAFLPADRIILAGVHQPEKIPEAERLSTQLLMSDLRQSGRDAWTIADIDAICEHLIKELREGDVVAMLSNGGFGGLQRKLMGHLHLRGRNLTNQEKQDSRIAIRRKPSCETPKI